MKNFQRKETQGNYIPEYQRLGKQPLQMVNQMGQQKNSQASHNTKQKIFNFKPQQNSQLVNQLEEEENEITSGEISEREIPNLLEFKVENYSYLVYYQGKCVEILSSEEELLQFIDQAVFTNSDPANPEDFEIFRKIPLGFGVFLKK